MRYKVAFSPSVFRDLHIVFARGVTALACCSLLAGCAGDTLFQSDFARFPTHWPPIGEQEVGTTAVDPVSDQYVWSGGPNGWVWISREDSEPVPRAALVCNFSEARGDGTYVFSTVLYVRHGAGAATIQFEPWNQPVTNYGNGFLHLDLMPDNSVRIDDNNATKFGTFPRDQEFILQVTLNINSTPTVRILLSGAGASGEADYTILPPYVALARQFGAVRLWMGEPSTEFCLATNIVVRRQ
jgi:hypothetical protein